MNMSENRQIKLKSFSFQESVKEQCIFNCDSVNLENFNLVIGDNAQGKTRLFRFFQTIQNLILGRCQLTSTINAEFIFSLGSVKSTEEIIYRLNINPHNFEGEYFEKITSGHKNYLCTENGEPRILLDEKTNKNIENFFIPKNTLAISALDADSFLTIRSIKEFFCRMLFIDADRTNKINVDVKANSLNSSCENLSSVILNWKKDKPEIYRELINDFKRCFPEIKEIDFEPLFLPNGRSAELLALTEKNIENVVTLPLWSSGMWRLFCLISLPKTQFSFNNVIYPPSLIFIDEVENGLDFKSLKFVIEYLKDYSAEMQIVLSSHSPLISEFIHPKNWHVIKRKGVNVRVSNPQNVEVDLDDKLTLFKQRYWEFYTKHICNSTDYEPE